MTHNHETQELVSSIASWLMTRRLQLATRAHQHRLPLTVAVEVPVATFTDGGLSSTMETRQTSLFWALGSVVHPMVYAAVTRPFIDDVGENLAQSLVESFGDHLKFWCHLGPVVVKQELQHPELITNVTAPEADRSDVASMMLGWQPIFYALMILRQCLIEYLSSVPSLGQDDPILAQNLAGDAIRFAAADDVTNVGRVPLAGIDVRDASIEINGTSVRRLTTDELGYLFERRHSRIFQPSRIAGELPGTFSAEMWLQERVLLEIRARHPKQSSEFFTLAPRCQKVLLAFHLLGVEFSGAGFGAMLQEPRWMWSMTGQSAHPLLMPKAPSQSLMTLETTDLEDAVSLANSIPDGAVSDPKTPMELSVRRLALAMSRPEATEALVDYTVALEALFLGGTEMGEARRRFALNGAVYAAATHAERKRLYGELSDIYRARSVMVHGVNPSERQTKKLLADIGTIRNQACQIARRSIRKALSSGWPDENTFLTALLADASPPQ